MPELGEVKKGITIGYKSANKFIWTACKDCGKERWVSYRNGKPKYDLCYSCSAKLKIGDKGSCWKGGRIQRENGYVEIWISPDDFFYPMANKQGYILEHRLVMAKSLGRCLQPYELVHHKGIRFSGIENKSDNLEDNLELACSRGEHSANHSKGYHDVYQKGHSDGKDKQIRELRKQIMELNLRSK